MNKYYSRKVTINGETFDSKKEAARWRELALLEKAGQITGLQRQVRFELLPAQYRLVATPKGQQKKCIERAVTYVADFVYKERLVPDGDSCVTVVEDTKGLKTKDYILKRKMLLYFHNIRIREI
jgi:hypothetical protein